MPANCSISVHFFGFFGALKKREFFGARPKKVRGLLPQGEARGKQTKRKALCRTVFRGAFDAELAETRRRMQFRWRLFLGAPQKTPSANPSAANPSASAAEGRVRGAEFEVRGQTAVGCASALTPRLSSRAPHPPHPDSSSRFTNNVVL